MKWDSFTYAYRQGESVHSTVHATLTTLSVDRVGPGPLKGGVKCSDIKGRYRASQITHRVPLATALSDCYANQLN